MFKWILFLLAGLVSVSARKKSAQPGDNPAIKKMEITKGFFIVSSTKFTLRRGTEVLVTKVTGRCKVHGFCNATTILVQLPDGTIMPFNKSRISLAPLHK